MTRVLRRALAAILGGGTVALLTGVLGQAASATDAVPYHDQSATGTITLCDKNLEPVTSGSVNDLPFAWRAVGSVPAPPPYNDGTGAAILYAFLPRQGVDPAQWNGELLTGSTTYHDTTHPMAQATPADWMLRYFTDYAVPNWDGFVQLRLYYQHKGTAQSTAYAAADIRVSGDEWQLVRGGSDSCGASADAKSVELAIPTYHQYVKRAHQDYVKYFKEHKLPMPTTTASPGSSSTSGGSTPSPTGSGSGSSLEAGAGSGVTANQAGMDWWPLAAVAVAVVLIGGGVALWRRPRSPRS